MEATSLSHKIFKKMKTWKKNQILYLKVSVYASSADLLTLYATTPGNATMEATDDMLIDPYFELKINCQKKVFNWFHPTAFCTKSFYNTFKDTIYISQHLRLNLPSINIDWFSSIPQSSTVMDSSSSSVMTCNNTDNKISINDFITHNVFIQKVPKNEIR